MAESDSAQLTRDTHIVNTEPPAVPEEVLTSEMLVEEVSIDGMCGVY
jgi:mycofactocin precursor